MTNVDKAAIAWSIAIVAVPMFVSEVWILSSAVCIDERSSPIELMASLICVISDRHTPSNFSSIFCTSD